MFELIAYIFKIIIALGVGFIIGYNYKKDQRSMQMQLNTTILSFLVTSLFGILVLSVNFDINFVSFIFIAIVYLVTKQYSDFDLIDKNRLIFAGINGIIIGLGYVFYSILITLFFSYLINNYDIISQLFNKEYWDLKENDEDDKNEIDINA